MKVLIFVFLGCIIYTVNGHLDLLIENEATFQRGLFSKVGETSEDFVSAIVNPFRGVYNQSMENLQETESRLNATQENVLKSFDSAVRGLKYRMLHMKNNPYMRECVEEHEIQLDEIRDEAFNKLQKCGENLMKNLHDQHKPIEDNLQEINDRVDEFRLGAVTCVQFNPVDTTDCVFNKISEYSAVIEEVGNSFNQAVTDATEYSGTYFDDELSRCNEKVVIEAFTNLHKFEISLGKCNIIH